MREAASDAWPEHDYGRLSLASPNGQLDAHSAMIESSRFCADTSVREGRRAGSVQEATLTMFAGIIELCLANDFTEIVTVTSSTSNGSSLVLAGRCSG